MVCSCAKFQLHHLPILTLLWFTLTLIISYVWALYNDHIYPLFPYISDTGTLSPESCLFGQMFNIGAVLSMISLLFIIISEMKCFPCFLTTICLYIRYRQVNFLNEIENSPSVSKLNKIGLYAGCIGCLGISIVGNFQESQFLSLHLVGAFMVFSSGAFILYINTILSFKLRSAYKDYPEFEVSNKMLYFRVFLTICAPMLQTSTVLFTLIAFLLHSSTQDNVEFSIYLHWTEEDGGYQFRLLATFSEYLLVIQFFCYVLTMTKEFKALEFKEICFVSKYAGKNTAN